MGAISDVIGRRPLLMGLRPCWGSLHFPALLRSYAPRTIPGPLFCSAPRRWSSYLGNSSINAVVKAELFPASVRALGVALPYAITVSIFGGTAEYAGLTSRDIGHEAWFYVYVTGPAIACSLVTLYFHEGHSKAFTDRRQ